MDNNLGNVIKNIRTKKKMSQRYLAEKAGISYSYLCNVENGKHKPSFEILDKIGKALEIKFTGEDEDTNYFMKEFCTLLAELKTDIVIPVIHYVNEHHVSEKYDLSSIGSDEFTDIHDLIVDVVKNRLNKYCKKIL